jgi:hypothetical protein
MAAKKGHLSVAPDGATPTKRPVPKSITEALEGASRDVLAAMRRALAKQLDDGKIAGNSIASAYRELRELDRLIRVADAEREAEERRGTDGDGQQRSFDASAI